MQVLGVLFLATTMISFVPRVSAPVLMYVHLFIPCSSSSHRFDVENCSRRGDQLHQPVTAVGQSLEDCAAKTGRQLINAFDCALAVMEARLYNYLDPSPIVGSLNARITSMYLPRRGLRAHELRYQLL